MYTDFLNFITNAKMPEKEKLQRTWNNIFGHLAGQLYPMMLFAANNDRRAEAEIFEEYRKKIFAIRDFYMKSEDPLYLFDRSHIIREIASCLRLYVATLANSETRQWEAVLYDSYINELLGIANRMEDSHPNNPRNAPADAG